MPELLGSIGHNEGNKSCVSVVACWFWLGCSALHCLLPTAICDNVVVANTKYMYPCTSLSGPCFPQKKYSSPLRRVEEREHEKHPNQTPGADRDRGHHHHQHYCSLRARQPSLLPGLEIFSNSSPLESPSGACEFTRACHERNASSAVFMALDPSKCST